MNLYRVMRSLPKEEVLNKARSLFRDMNSMPYCNESAAEGVLNTNGVKSWNTVMDINPTMVWDWINEPEKASVMPNMTYMRRPCGSQNSPDFIVKLEEGVLLGLEYQSSNKMTQGRLIYVGNSTEQSEKNILEYVEEMIHTAYSAS